MKLIFIISTAIWIISFPSLRLVIKELYPNIKKYLIECFLSLIIGGSVSLSVLSFIKLSTMKERIICTLLAFGLTIIIALLTFAIILLIAKLKAKQDVKDGD